MKPLSFNVLPISQNIENYSNKTEDDSRYEDHNCTESHVRAIQETFVTLLYLRNHWCRLVL